ncbi:MAG: hypothetical protein ABI623_03970 [bacterium]
MEIPAGKYIVEVKMVKEQGNNWVVRLVRKILFFRKTVSSDWFLQEQQARTFANKLAEQMKSGSDTEGIKNRKPGWVLTAPVEASALVTPAIKQI